jgi:hypothetical protein
MADRQDSPGGGVTFHGEAFPVKGVFFMGRDSSNQRARPFFYPSTLWDMAKYLNMRSPSNGKSFQRQRCFLKGFVRAFSLCRGDRRRFVLINIEEE